MKEKWILFCSIIVIFAWILSCSDSQNRPDPEVFQLLRASSSSGLLSSTQTTDNISIKPQITLEFTSSVDSQSVKNAISLKKENTTTNVELEFSFFDSGKTVQIKTSDSLDYKSLYSFHIGENLKGFEGQAFPGISYSFLTENGTLSLLAATLNGINLLYTSTITEIDYSSQVFEFQFSDVLPMGIDSKFVLQPNANFSVVLSADKKKVSLTVIDDLDYYTKYSIIISSGLKSANDFEFKGFSKAFNTGLNSSIKFPLISDEELLTLVQKQTFTYFW
ncbi:MAG: Ig-like domain-containing protein, partial [Bacteroidetes bacterium]|nr:Ig-like domain-containing protein [Bacteroidota bacterium]